MLILLLFSRYVMSNSLQLHGLKHSRLLWSSRSPRICSNSCPLSQWCYLTISSSATPFSFCLQSFPIIAYGSKQRSVKSCSEVSLPSLPQDHSHPSSDHQWPPCQLCVSKSSIGLYKQVYVIYVCVRVEYTQTLSESNTPIFCPFF